MNRFLRLTTCLATLATPLEATSPPSPFAHVVAATPSDYCFFMGPDRLDSKVIVAGICYRIEKNLSLTKIWSVNGFYAFPGFVRLSDDGRWLVHARNLFHATVNKDTVLVEVFENGVLKSTLPVGLFVDNLKTLREDSGASPERTHLLKYDSEPFFDLVDGYDMNRILESDGKLRESSGPLRFGDIPEGYYVRVDTIEGFRIFVNIKSGKIAHKYELRRANP